MGTRGGGCHQGSSGGSGERGVVVDWESSVSKSIELSPYDMVAL